MCFVKIFSTRRKVILKQILNLVHQLFIINCIVMIWFSCNFFVKNVGIFPYLLKHMQMKDVKDFFFKKVHWTFKIFLKKRIVPFLFLTFFEAPREKMCVRGQTWFHTKVEQMKRKEEEKKKLLSYLCVLHFTNLWARWIWKKNIPHSFPISGSSDFV